MKKNIYLVILALSITCVGFSQTEKTKQTTETKKEQSKTVVINKIVTPEEFKKLMAKKDAQLIDVRTPGEYNEGHISNAKNIDFNSADFKAKLEKLDKNKPVLVYCAVGGRSGKAAAMLKEMGFKEVYDLKGGFNAWK
jgi:rhodanese-related sulfurtransferase